MAKIIGTVVSVERERERVAIGIEYSGTETKIYRFDLPVQLKEIRDMVKAEVNRLNSIQGQVDQLTALIGTVIE